jgi:hypothetical protein
MLVQWCCNVTGAADAVQCSVPVAGADADVLIALCFLYSWCFAGLTSGGGALQHCCCACGVAGELVLLVLYFFCLLLLLLCLLLCYQGE